MQESGDTNIPYFDDKRGMQMPYGESRRQTMRSEVTMHSEPNFLDYDVSSDENDGDYIPWVDRVKLRHGMDWLDLITNEVDRDTMRVNMSLVQRQSDNLAEGEVRASEH